MVAAGAAFRRAADYGGPEFAMYYANIVFDFESGRIGFRPSIRTAYGMWRGLEMLLS